MNHFILFLILLFPLVIFHEFGHFIMAKLGGIKVSQFSFGFGPKLFSFHFKGTEYRWNLLPLGGYVDFMGEVVYTNEIPDDVRHFYNKPKWLRFLVLLMGPLFNLFLALGVFWLLFGLRPYYEAVYHNQPYTVGYVDTDSPEAKAGLLPGDRILSINDTAIKEYRTVWETIVLNPEQELTLTVEDENGRKTLTYTVPEDIEGGGVMGFGPLQRVEIGEVVEGAPAESAGLQDNDIVTRINGKVVVANASENSLAQMVQGSDGRELVFTVERDGRTLDIPVTPNKEVTKSEDGTESTQWLIGVRYGGETRKVDLGWGQAFMRGVEEVKNNSTLLYRALRNLLVGKLSIKALSGPVGVARAAKSAWDAGIWVFLGLLAMLSVQLCILNLLPIPVLDGGEIFVLLVEWIARKDFSLANKIKIKMVGFFFLIGLIGVILVSDVIKALQSSGALQ